jgi:hypothetical protein
MALRMSETTILSPFLDVLNEAAEQPNACLVLIALFLSGSSNLRVQST